MRPQLLAPLLATAPRPMPDLGTATCHQATEDAGGAWRAKPITDLAAGFGRVPHDLGVQPQ